MIHWLETYLIISEQGPSKRYFHNYGIIAKLGMIEVIQTKKCLIY